RRGKDFAARCRTENPAYGLEHARSGRRTPGARALDPRPEGQARLFRPFLSPQRDQRVGCAGARRLRWTGDRNRRPRHHVRHEISPREEPAFWPGPDLEFLEVEAVILFPAIDLKEGQCVRLEQGDMARATVFNLDPAAQATSFAAQGFEYLHVVDLDGAFAG